jgi:hypothetical protein
MCSSLTALHRAVITDDLGAVRFFVESGKFVDERDRLGLTPFQLAQLLGRYDCLLLLGGVLPTHVLAQLKGKRQIDELSITELEHAFNIIYRPYLTFASYNTLQEVIQSCPYILRSHYLAEENYIWGHLYKNPIQRGMVADVYIRWIDDMLGYGLFAAEDLHPGAFVGEYTGVVRRLYKGHPDPNAYCLHYPTKFWSWKYFAVDALHEGNLMRFINHSDDPNLKPLCTVENGLLRQVFVMKRAAKADTQLTFDYGVDYWQKRQKI